ncbi:hypothetical protein [Sulfitobacter phage vB_SupP_AX]|nr:hypothetical protein [Sulfitobacter phage vB_SupP_AX]
MTKPTPSHIECCYITRVCKMEHDGAEKTFLVSYNWLLHMIIFTCRDDVQIQGEFKLSRPFASREPADFLLINEVSNYLDHTPAEREIHYA